LTSPPKLKPSVFISYRRDGGFALAKYIREYLVSQTFDVFMDVHSITAGAFESVTLEEIDARDCFMIILTIGSLQRMADDEDWLRKEFEQATKSNRTILPVMDVGFSLDQEFQRLPKPLVSSLQALKHVQWLRVPEPEYFDAAMERLSKFICSVKPTQKVQSITAPSTTAPSTTAPSTTAPSSTPPTSTPPTSTPPSTTPPSTTPPSTTPPSTTARSQRLTERRKRLASAEAQSILQATSLPDLSSLSPQVRAGSWKSLQQIVFSSTLPLVSTSPAPLAAPELSEHRIIPGTLQWSVVPGAQSYVLERRQRRQGSGRWISVYNGPETSYRGPVLTRDEDYRVKAVGSQPQASSDWSNVITVGIDRLFGR
jgi:TIR domain